MVGCDWTGLFKDLTKHLDSCQFITVECKKPGCDERVLMSDLESHLKEKCPNRQVECKDCGKKMSFIELQEHTEQCPNAPKVCENCHKKILASQFLQHIMECKHIKCVCKENDVIYEVGSDKFKLHLEDTSKLADHLAPMIREFSKMSLAFQEMTAAYQLSTNKIKQLETKCQVLEELKIKNKLLEKNSQQSIEKIAFLENKSGVNEKKINNLHKKIVTIAKQVEIIQNQNAQLSEKNVQLQEKVSLAVAPRNSDPQVKQIQQKVEMLENKTKQLESLQLQQQQTVAIKKSAYGEVVQCEKPPSSELVKQVEDKVLEVERMVNAIAAYQSELELQLQASLATTYNGIFLWRIPEVRRRIRDARIGGITSIYSPPFYTGRNGYKMCIRVYLNGVGTGKGTHLSIFFVLMRGEHDTLLYWPFEHQVELILVDQDHKKHLVQTFKPNVQSSNFKRPVNDICGTSGSFEFAELSILDNPSYIKEDVMYIKAIVDTSKIFHL
ncbi:TNF receptor-associated factor 3-like isoform X2 [Dysidea avara]